jgi:hypothetical protein
MKGQGHSPAGTAYLRSAPERLIFRPAMLLHGGLERHFAGEEGVETDLPSERERPWIASGLAYRRRKGGPTS